MGSGAFVQHLDRGKTPLIESPIVIAGEHDGVSVDMALEWNDSYHETMLCFTNNDPQRDGGTHLAGFPRALTRTVNGYAHESRRRQEGEKVAIGRRRPRGVDLRGFGQGSGSQVFVPDKDKLVSSEVRPIVESIAAEKIGQWFEEHPNDEKRVVGKVIEVAIARDAARKARDLTQAQGGA